MMGERFYPCLLSNGPVGWVIHKDEGDGWDNSDDLSAIRKLYDYTEGDNRPPIKEILESPQIPVQTFCYSVNPRRLSMCSCELKGVSPRGRRGRR